jgi:hypothetical protein
MIDLDEIRTENVPRSDVLARRFAARLEPGMQYAVFAPVWLLVAATLAVAVTVGVVLLGERVSPGSMKGNPIAIWSVWIPCFAAAWIPFALWVRRRRARARRLFVEGRLATARLGSLSVMRVNLAPVTRAAVDLGPGRRRYSISVGGTSVWMQAGLELPVLYLDDYPYAAVFHLGRMIVAGPI